jgi:hypothetical protein
MISTEQVKQAIEDCKKAGHEIGIRDIAYVFLSKNFDDIRMPYRCLFGLDVDYNPEYADTYDKTGTMQYLKGYVDMNFSDGTQKKKRKKSEDDDDDITFEENKAYMLKLKKDIEKAIEDGEMEKKDGYKALADISVKLNDKFQVQGEDKEQIIIVNAKYNALCDCGKEIYIPTKEDLMEKYNLVEKTE